MPAPRKLLGPRRIGWTFFDPINLTTLGLLGVAALLVTTAIAARNVLDWQIALLLYASLLAFLRLYLFHDYRGRRLRRWLTLLVLLGGLCASGALFGARAASFEILRGGQRVRLPSDARFLIAALLHGAAALLLLGHALTKGRRVRRAMSGGMGDSAEISLHLDEVGEGWFEEG